MFLLRFLGKLTYLDIWTYLSSIIIVITYKTFYQNIMVFVYILYKGKLQKVYQL